MQVWIITVEHEEDDNDLAHDAIMKVVDSREKVIAYRELSIKETRNDFDEPIEYIEVLDNESCLSWELGQMFYSAQVYEVN